MANEEQRAILKSGVEAWNAWRERHRGVVPDLRRADLSGADLREAELRRANLFGANLGGTLLSGANLRGANLWRANLRRSDLREADLRGADLTEANLHEANLTEANLSRGMLVHTELHGALLTGCRIYGISAWDLHLEAAVQQDLIITPEDQPTITVDNVEVAQFVYMLLNNRRIRQVIDTIGKKAVLILGRFTPERKAVLDAMRQWLREHDYLPILFDFELPGERDVTETITLLARMARFIIADLTAPSSISKELEAIVPTLAVPVQPLLEGSTIPYSMFKDYWKYDWVLQPHRYASVDDLLASLNETVVAPAESKVTELRRRRLAALAE